MIKPEFPYKGNQVIVTSERLVFHSRKDGVFLFGKATVGISSIGTVNVDSKEGLKISAPYIELGLNAKQVGEQAVLGNTLVSVLSEVNDALSSLANALSKVDGTDETAVALSMSMLKATGDGLVTATKNFQNNIENSLSDATYTL